MASTFNDEPDFIARLFQLPVLQRGLLRHAEAKAEHRDQPLHLQNLQENCAPLVGQPIQFYELDRTAQKSQATGCGFAMPARINALADAMRP